MKTKITFRLLLCVMLLGFTMQTYGQDKVNLSVGIGLPELLNLGVRGEIDQFQLGFSIGAIPLKDETIFSVSGDVSYHFAGHSDLSSRRPWYGRLGVNYLRDETDNFIDKYSYLTLRFGRDLNITKEFGVEIDAGFMYQIYHDKIIKKSLSGWNFNFDFPLLPSLGICLYYRI